MAAVEKTIQTLAVISGTITLSASILATLYQSRRGKGRRTGRGAKTRTLPGMLLMTAGFLAAGILLWRPVPLKLPDLPRLVLIILGSLSYFPGLGLYLWGLFTLGRHFRASGLLGAELHHDHALITTGPFRIIRHPMYAGVLLAALGGLAIFRTWAMVVFVPMSLVVVFRAENEEKLLEQEYGEEWRSYASKVPKWFPRI
jgi:protein-S-isoprenylcysteine O-methyltransferase